MRALIVLLPLALAGAAAAQPANETPPSRTIQCIEAGGRPTPPVCKVPSGRLDLREDICTCPDGGQRVEVAVCEPGQTPPAEGKALNIARSEAARDGSLIGDTMLGKPICVAPRRP